MCNIAGYVGSQPAAPILIEMMRREEGWAGGYYTGLATIHEGKIHYAKCVGDLDKLLDSTDAAELPGCIGIIHSRSKSGGDAKWAHPFVSKRDDNVTAAYVANGSQGFFAPQQRDVTPLAARLSDAGYIFDSREPFAVGNYPKLPDGSCVHMSDVMAQLIASRINEGTPSAEAMSTSFCEMPSEIVGLLLSLAEPESISWARVNMPMSVAFAPHGAYLSSTPQAFPDDAGVPTLLPALSGGRVFAGHFTAAPFDTPPCRVAPITPRVVSEAYAEIARCLCEKPSRLSELIDLVKPLFDEADCFPAAALCYSILSDLQNAGRLTVAVENVSGAQEDLTAPQFFAGLR